MPTPRIRTLREAAAHFQQQDPGSYISEAFLRKQLRLGRLPFFKSGNRALLNLDEIEDILSALSALPMLSPVEVKPARKFRRID